MTKGAWIELIITYLEGGIENEDLRGRYHPQVIEEYFNIIYNDILFATYTIAGKTSDYGQLDQYTKTFKNVAVNYDNDRGEYYSIIPASYITLPRNRGIRLISPMQDQKHRFVYRENNTNNVYDELEVSSVVPDITFYVESRNVYYGNYNDVYSQYGLLFKMVCPLSEFDENDEIGIPSSQSGVIFEKIIQLLLQRPPEKFSKDGQSKQI